MNAVRLFCATLLVAICAIASADHEMRVVRNVRLYENPSSMSSRIDVLTPGYVVVLLSATPQNNYLQVRTQNGLSGWVFRHRVSRIEHDGFTRLTGTRAFAELRPLADDEMRVHFIDVGQGDATLLEFPCGVALIDTGGEQSPDFQSVETLRAYLDAMFAARPELGSRFDLLAITHPHIDHTRGLEMVSENYWVANVIDNGQRNEDIGGRPQIDLQDWARENATVMGYRGIRKADVSGANGLTDAVIDPIDACDASPVDPRLRVLWGQLGPADTGHGNTNNHSLVLRVDFGEFSLLLTGDLQESAINSFLDKYDSNPDLLDVDLYQVGHHGSHNATTDDLMSSMTPDLCVCSMGPFERERGRFIARQFAHPHEDAIEAIAAGTLCERDPLSCQIGIKGAFASNPSEFEARTISTGLFATGWDGNVVVTASSDGSFRVWTERQGEVEVTVPGS